MNYKELKDLFLNNSYDKLLSYLKEENPDKSIDFFNSLFSELKINSEDLYKLFSEEQIDLYSYLGTSKHLYDYSKKHKISARDKLLLAMA